MRLLSLSTFVLVGLSLCFCQQAEASILTFDASTPAENSATRASWLSASGIAVPENLVNFESGFVLNQNISGLPGLFPGGLVLTDSGPGTPRIIIRSIPGSIGGSNPIGSFSATQDEQAYLILDFSAMPVDYVAFQDIDHTGTSGRVTFVGGATEDISLETTGTSGNTGEFFGIFRNDMPRITLVELNASGDGLWGVDTIEYGGAASAVPEPSSFVLMGLVLVILFARSRIPLKRQYSAT